MYNIHSFGKKCFFLNPKYNLIYNFFMKNKDKHFNK